MEAEGLFQEQLPLIERAIGGVCRRAGLRGADAEDLDSMVKLALIENDYAVLRSWTGRAPLGAFLTVVAQRVLSRERARLWGRWRASAEAERLGPAAIWLEKLLQRDGRALEEAVPIVRALQPSLSETDVRSLADRLPPRRVFPRAVPLTGAELAAPDRADTRAREDDARRMSERAAQIVRETIAALPPDERMLVRLHFGAGRSIADAARILGVPQRPLYRRIETLLRQLRAALEREGAGAAVIEEIVAAGSSDGFDFGLRQRKNDSGRHTFSGDGA